MIIGLVDTYPTSSPCFINQTSSKTARIGYGNGAQSTCTYDPQSARLTGILTSDSGQTPIFNKSYAYSPAGDITQITDLRANSAYAYEYDALHRLTAETNLYGATATTVSILSFEYTAGSVHGVDRITDEIYDAQYDLGYDGNGNQTSGVDLTNPAQPVERTIHYNAGNMPTRIDMDGVQASAITYDGENARAAKASTGSATYYINPYFEIENGVETRYIFGNNTRIARIKGADTLYFHKDHLGSTAVLTGSNGLEIAPPTGYLPYGMDRNGNGQAVSAYKFTDQEQEQETGLYNYDARLYDPVTGVFVSADSIVPDWFDPQSLNRYAYARNNPLVYTDPTGHIFQLAVPVLYWAIETILLPDIQIDLELTAVSLAENDYWGAAFNAACIALPGISGGGTLAKEIKSAVKGTDSGLENLAAKGGTEVVQRAMSRAELEAIQNSGVLSRGGRAGDHFVSDAVNSSANRARQRLALPGTPEVRATLEVPPGVFSTPSKVAPKFNMPGGGMERTAPGNIDVPARILDVLEY